MESEPPENFGLTEEDFEAAAVGAIKIGSTCEDTSNSERFVEQHRKMVRYAYTWNTWLAWDNLRWKRDDGEMVSALAKKTARSIYKEAQSASEDGQAKRLGRWAERSLAKERINAMIWLARSDPRIQIAVEKLDVDSFTLSCANGTLNLYNGEFHKHRQQDFLTKVAGVDYDPEAECPRWMAFLGTAFQNNQTLADYVQEIAGYCLTGEAGEQCWFFLHGPGANGKTTFTEVLRLLLGEYASEVRMETFLFNKNGHGVRDDLAGLTGQRLIFATEASGGTRLDDAALKQFTGGEPITARHLYGRYFSYVPKFKIFICGNHKPAVRDSSQAMWRRVRLIPFDYVIPEQQRIKDYARKLVEAEGPGILNWCFAGLRRWKDRGRFITPNIVRVATDKYQSESDLVGQFVAKKCRKDPQTRVEGRELYRAFRAWCEGDGLRKPPTKTYFTQELTRLGYPLDLGERHYQGLELAQWDPREEG